MLLTALVALSGCDTLWRQLDPTAVSPRGLSPSVEALNFSDLASRQTKLLDALKVMADEVQEDGTAKPDSFLRPPDWQNVTKSGIAFVGDQCNEYLAALFRFDRDERALRSGLTATGTATATILGLTKVAGAPIAITAAAFGLAAAFFDANVNSVVYAIGPAAVRNIVTQAQDAYRTTVMNNLQNYTARPDVILALQGYLQLCTPVAIQSAIEQASASTHFQSKVGPHTTDPSPALQQTSTQPPAIISSVISPSSATQRIESWLRMDRANAQRLVNWMQTQTIDVHLRNAPPSQILTAGGGPGESSPQQMEADREAVISHFEIP